jgi:hypothetical protein
MQSASLSAAQLVSQPLPICTAVNITRHLRIADGTFTLIPVMTA